MSSGFEQREIVVFASPDELRRWADEMEKRWLTIRPGEVTFIDFLMHKQDMKVSLHLDQQWFHKREQEMRKS